MEPAVYKILNNLKDKYKSIIFERIQYINPSTLQKYCLVYCFPIQLEFKHEENLGILFQNNGIVFERFESTIQEFEDFLNQFKSELNDEKIRFPDGLEIENIAQKKNISEWLVFSSDYDKLGKVAPNYRFMIDLDDIVSESEFSIVSMTGFPTLDSASKGIFKHETNIFGHSNHSSLYRFLVVDLSHFSWYIKNLKIQKTEVSTEISQMSNKRMEKPLATVIGVFNDNSIETKSIRFDKRNIMKINFEKPLSSCKIYLLANSDIGFSGDKHSNQNIGKLLDFAEQKQYITYSYQEKFKTLDNLTIEDIKNIILDGENEQVEFKQKGSEKYGKIGFNIETIAKQLISMINNKNPGIIILGVSNDGEISDVKGIKLDKIIDVLQDHLEDKCEPKITVIGKKFFPFEKKPSLKIFVLAALSEEGKLYSYKQKGETLYFPIRRGATTRGMKSKEVEESYSLKNEE